MSRNPNFGKVSGKSCLPAGTYQHRHALPSPTLSSPESFTLRRELHASPHSSQIFHYAKGQPYIDEVGTFKERIQWVGDPHRKDGSIVIHNLDYGDNGTFTCDVKNPPDIVGKTSQVTLYVFEKGVRGGGTGVWEAVHRGDQAWLRGWGKGQNVPANAPHALGQWAEGSLVQIS